MNELIEAAREDSQENKSKERFEKMKKKEAGTVDRDPAKQRYQELKEKAKREMMREERRQKEKENDEEKEKEFITF